jgi:DEAD/DEAH box helicase domain-containing protein
MEEVSNLGHLNVGADTIVFDCEIADEIKSPDGFNRPWEYRPSVFCTYTDAHGFRDWIGEDAIPAFINYLTRHTLIVGYNHIKFDFGIIDGSLIRGFEGGRNDVRKIIGGIIDLGERDPAPGMTASLLRTKSIDLLIDIGGFLDDKGFPRMGRRMSLDRVASASVGAGKDLQGMKSGGEAPLAWQRRQCHEVIGYCRGDVLITAQTYVHLRDGGNLYIDGWPARGRNDLGGPVILRRR